MPRHHTAALRRAALVLLLVASAACSATGPAQSDQPTSTTAASAPSSTESTSPDTATPIDQLSLRTPDGRDRTYYLHVPPTLPEGPVPLLIALHGGVGSGLQFELNSDFDQIAAREGLIVVYPNGVGVGPQEDRLRTWNGGYCCGPAARDGIDDVTFIGLLIDTIATEYDIDPDRVFAAGHSNGGIMAYRLACELSDRIVAVGLQAGSLGIDDCDPTQAVSLLHLHGTADTNHPIDGGHGTTGISGVEFRSARTSVSDFAAIVGCPAEPEGALDPANRDATVQSWQPCDDGAEVRFVAVAGAPHAWMGHSTRTPQLVGEPYMGLDASELIIDFLLAHPRR